MWVLKLVSCFRVTRAEACKLCVRLHIVVADAAVVAVAVAWHECLMRDGSDRQLLPAIGTNAGHTGQTKKQKAKQSKPKKKKGKIQFASCGCGFYLYVFFHKFTFVVFCSVLGICELVQGLDTYVPPLHCDCPPPPTTLYTFRSHCLFMSFCLCCLACTAQTAPFLSDPF